MLPEQRKRRTNPIRVASPTRQHCRPLFRSHICTRIRLLVLSTDRKERDTCRLWVQRGGGGASGGRRGRREAEGGVDLLDGTRIERGG